MTSNSDKSFYINLKASEECLCGKEKKPGFPFCYLCYKELPDDLKKALYNKFGFKEAVDEAVKHLQSEVW